MSPEKDHQFWPEGPSPFDPKEIMVLIPDHLEEILVIDARPDQAKKSIQLMKKTDLFPESIKKELEYELQNFLEKTQTFKDLLNLPQQMRVIIAVKLGESIFKYLPCPKSAILPVHIVECGLVENFWHKYRQDLLNKVAGNIDLARDLRENFEYLITGERKQIIKDEGTFETLWQNPNLN